MADVYILANKPRGTLYVGVTNDLVRRVYQHEGGGSTRRYGLKQLVYLAKYDTSALAMQREKDISINPGSGAQLHQFFKSAVARDLYNDITR